MQIVKVESFEVNETPEVRKARALDGEGNIVYTVRSPKDKRDFYNPEHSDNRVEFGEGVQHQDIELFNNDQD